MTEPEIDKDTAAAEAEDQDFGEEHTEPTYRDEPMPGGPDEATPDTLDGMDQGPDSP